LIEWTYTLNGVLPGKLEALCVYFAFLRHVFCYLRDGVANAFVKTIGISKLFILNKDLRIGFSTEMARTKICGRFALLKRLFFQ
jgi:hypothetical protein